MTSEDILIATFNQKLAERVRFRNTVIRPSFTEQLGEALDWPAVVAYGKVCAVGMFGLCGLLVVVVALGALALP
jgi:hypothetical protein